jgi:hypothetical protein
MGLSLGMKLEGFEPRVVPEKQAEPSNAVNSE